MPWERERIGSLLRDIRGDERRFIREKGFDVLSDRLEDSGILVVGDRNECPDRLRVEDVEIVPLLIEVLCCMRGFVEGYDFVVDMPGSIFVRMSPRASPTGYCARTLPPAAPLGYPSSS